MTIELSEKVIDAIADAVVKKMQEPECEDCISRKEMLKYQEYLHGKMSNEENHKLWEFIKQLPSVTPKAGQKWIPCAERLPKRVENVLAYDGLNMSVAWYVPDGLHEGWHSFDDAFDDYTQIIAWMPLPEPYKAESEE